MASKQVFEAMNGVRGVAALVVVFDHCATIGWFGGELAGRFVDYGPLAVDLFFVLSGFVIAHAYADRLAQGMKPRDFLLARLIRLYPLYVMGIAVGCITPLLSALHNGRLVEAQIPAVTSVPFAFAMLPSPVIFHWSQILYPLNGPAWSLFFELLINGLYASTWRLWTKGSTLVIMGISALALLWLHDPAGGWNWATLPAGFARVCYSFPAGVLVYRFHREGVKIPSVCKRLVIAALPALFLLPNFWCKTLAVLAAFPLIVALCAQINTDRLSAFVCARLGAASYAVYAIHDPLLLLTNNIASEFGDTHHSPLLGAAFIFASIPACLVIDRIYDQPIRASLMRRVFRR